MNQPSSAARVAWKNDLEEQVAELLLEVIDGLGRSVEAVDRFEGLVGLLEQVAGERAMGLLPIPRTLTAQGAHELRKANELGRYGCVQRRDPERGEVVGRERAVELGPLELDDLFVGQTEVMEHDDAVGRLVVDGELDVGEHRGRVALSDDERPTLAGGVDGEPLAVDESHAGRERIDAEARPDEVEERQRRHDRDLDTIGRPRKSSTVRSATSGDPGTA